MEVQSAGAPALDLEHCRARQAGLRRLLQDLNLDAALFSNRHYVYWATGYWSVPELVPVAALIPADGPVVLVTHDKDALNTAADEITAYVPHKLCTLVENLNATATSELKPRLEGMRRIGTEGVGRPWLSETASWVDITSEFQSLRRSKYPDEVDAIRFSIASTDAAYAKAREILQPGLSEIELFAAMLEAATLAAGEQLSGWGNDFQVGTAGGPPRCRAAEEGELAILDIGVGIRGYRSDLCRTFAVNGSPSKLQQEAHGRIVEALAEVERLIQPGLRCTELYDTTHKFLDGWQGYSFFHHLGHGIGLDGHEVPRLNPHWNDTFQVGDIVAVEPGLYGEPLYGGIRLEQNYLITETGVERLSHFPLDL